MRPEQIEGISVSHLKLKLISIPALKVNFYENDKTPFYDGEISIYNVQGSEQVRKEKIVSEVRVQIKGTTDEKVLKKAKDSVAIKDLNGFSKLQGGGCFYFIVCISEDALEKIYYYDFQPFELKRILDEKGHQGTITIDLKEFPSKHLEIVNLLKTFAINLDYQSRDVLTADVSNLPTDKISIKYHGRREDYKKYMNSGAVVYVSTQENINIPVGQVVPNSAIYLSESKIQLDDGTRLKGIVSRDDIGNISITIDNTLKIRFDSEKIHFNFKLDNSFTIEEIITCIDNLEKLFNNGFYVGENFEKHIKINKYFSQENLNDFKDLYDFRDELNKILQLLQKLQVNTKIKYHELSEEDKIRLHNLLEEFETTRPNGKMIKFELEGIYHYFLNSPQHIGNLFKMDEEIAISIRRTNEEDVITSELDSFSSLVPRNQLSKVIDYDVDSIHEILNRLYIINTDINAVNSHVNDYLLTVIKIYDESDDERFLELAINITELLLKNSTDIVYYINYYQVLKRRRELSIIEKQELKKLLTKKESLIEEVCIKIILEEDISQLVEQLDNTTKSNLQNWPIYNLYNT